LSNRGFPPILDTPRVGSDEVEIVRGAFGTFAEAAGGATAERRAELTERWFHPDVEYVEDQSWPGATSYRGRDAVRQAFEGYEEILSGELAIEEVREGSNGVFAQLRYRGASTGADVPFDQSWGYHCRIRDGQLAYFRAYFDVDEALAAAGVDSA
jgi:ketosteroid isomerase-like protein